MINQLLMSVKPLLTETLRLTTVDGDLLWQEIERGQLILFDDEEVKNFEEYAAITTEHSHLERKTKSLAFSDSEGNCAMYSLLHVPGTALADKLMRLLDYCPRYLLLMFSAVPNGIGMHSLGLALGNHAEASFDIDSLQTQFISMDGLPVKPEVYYQACSNAHVFGLWRFLALDLLSQLGLITLQECGTGTHRHFHGQVGSLHKSGSIH